MGSISRMRPFINSSALLCHCEINSRSLYIRLCPLRLGAGRPCPRHLFPTKPAGDAALRLGSALLNLLVELVYLLESVGFSIFGICLGVRFRPRQFVVGLSDLDWAARQQAEQREAASVTAEKKNPLAQQEPYRGVELGPGLGTQLLGLLLGLLRAARDLAADFCGCLVHVACGESAPGGLKALEGHRGPSGAVGGGAKLGERPL